MITRILRAIDKRLGNKTGAVLITGSALGIGMQKILEIEDSGMSFAEDVPNLGVDHERLLAHVKLLFPISIDIPNQDHNRKAWLMQIHYLRKESTRGWVYDIELDAAHKAQARERFDRENAVMLGMQRRAVFRGPTLHAVA